MFHCVFWFLEEDSIGEKPMWVYANFVPSRKDATQHLTSYYAVSSQGYDRRENHEKDTSSCSSEPSEAVWDCSTYADMGFASEPVY